MRTFGSDAPEFFCFQLEGSNVVYKIPLAASLPVKVLLSLNDDLASEMALLEKYMGDAADGLTVDTVNSIFLAWAQASREQGATVGESVALSD